MSRKLADKVIVITPDEVAAEGYSPLEYQQYKESQGYLVHFVLNREEVKRGTGHQTNDHR